MPAPAGNAVTPLIGRVVTTITSAILVLEGRDELRTPSLGGIAALGVAAIAVGVVMLIWCSRRFVVQGKGTPNPLDPPRFLVAGGMYRLVRNPMYVAMGLVVAGEALLFRSSALLAYLAAVMIVFHLFVVTYEEPTLRRLFGADYDRYCRSVPRWIPRPPAF